MGRTAGGLNVVCVYSPTRQRSLHPSSARIERRPTPRPLVSAENGGGVMNQVGDDEPKGSRPDSTPPPHRRHTGRVRALRRHARLCVALGGALWLVGGSWLPAAAGVTATVNWDLRDKECGATEVPDLEVPCGSLGVFRFTVDTSHGGLRKDTGAVHVQGAGEAMELCAAVVGNEIPPTYPQPRPPLAVSESLTMESLDPSRPWVALVDWNDWHGWSVGLAIQTVSQLPVQIYPLDDPGLAVLGDEVSDAHVLAQMCQLTEDIEMGVVTPPLVLNMSFGRLPESADLLSANTCEESTEKTLSCQIRRVVDHLADAFGVVAVAAAGHHKEELFPATYERVLAAGTLDLTVFHQSGAGDSAWEAPGSFGGLFPAYGLCLVDDETAPSFAWSVPAGSSYASALFAGWLAGTMVRETVADPFSGALWLPHRICSYTVLGGGNEATCSYVLQHGNWQYSSVNPQPLLDRLRGIGPQHCAGKVRALQLGGPTYAVAEVPDLVLPPSYVEAVYQAPAQIGPAPEPDPCVPCMGSKAGGGSGLLLDLGWGRARRAQAESGDLVLDLSESFALAPGITVKEVYLRIGDSFFLIPLDSQTLVDFAAGDLEELVLENVFEEVKSEQSSLVYILLLENEEFWSSTPILIQN